MWYFCRFIDFLIVKMGQSLTCSISIKMLVQFASNGILTYSSSILKVCIKLQQDDNYLYSPLIWVVNQKFKQLDNSVTLFSFQYSVEFSVQSFSVQSFQYSISFFNFNMDTILFKNIKLKRVNLFQTNQELYNIRNICIQINICVFKEQFLP